MTIEQKKRTKARGKLVAYFIYLVSVVFVFLAGIGLSLLKLIFISVNIDLIQWQHCRLLLVSSLICILWEEIAGRRCNLMLLIKPTPRIDHSPRKGNFDLFNQPRLWTVIENKDFEVIYPALDD